jgi:hypothetical protein
VRVSTSQSKYILTVAQNPKGLLDVRGFTVIGFMFLSCSYGEIPGQRYNAVAGRLGRPRAQAIRSAIPFCAVAERLSSTPFHNVKTFNWTQPSSDIEAKQKECQLTQYTFALSDSFEFVISDCIARVTILLVRKMVYGRTHPYFTFAGSGKRRRSRTRL